MSKNRMVTIAIGLALVAGCLAVEIILWGLCIAEIFAHGSATGMTLMAVVHAVLLVATATSFFEKNYRLIFHGDS